MTDGEILIALGEHDLQIMRAEKELDELPEKKAILQLRHRLKEIETVREKAAAYCRKAEAMVAKANDDTAMIQAKLDAEQAKVTSGEVTNPKELQNLTRELDALKRRIDATEHETLKLMEKAETGEQQLAKVNAALADGQKKEAELIAAFQKRGGELQTEIGRLTGERDALASRLSDALKARYESLRESKHGIGVGSFAGGMCSACRTQLPAGEAQAIQAGPEIAECPNCKRLLVVRAEAS